MVASPEDGVSALAVRCLAPTSDALADDCLLSCNAAGSCAPQPKEKMLTEEDVAFQKKQAAEKKALKEAAAKMAGKKNAVKK